MNILLNENFTQSITPVLEGVQIVKRSQTFTVNTHTVENNFKSSRLEWMDTLDLLTLFLGYKRMPRSHMCAYSKTGYSSDK